MKKLVLLLSFVFVMGLISVNAQNPEKKQVEKPKTTQTVKKPAADTKKPVEDVKKKNDGKKTDGKKNNGKTSEVKKP